MLNWNCGAAEATARRAANTWTKRNDDGLSTGAGKQVRERGKSQRVNDAMNP